ncbi:MAG: peptidase T [Actinobacteria bacterium]|nr:peptidase T [Actinomycetota bacterium]
MAVGAYTSPLARRLAQDALERFLRYVRIDTQSDPRSETFPSTPGQLDLSRLLERELLSIGLSDAELDEHGYVFATLPATTERALPTVGLIAHVDTSPDASGSGVEPQVVRYDGRPIVLPGDPRQVLRQEDIPELADHVGHELVTSDGTTLLGADDKGGVAEIMAAVAYLHRHPELEHGRVRVAFTPDEEIGEGTKHFGLERFGADVAYTLDGSTLGEIQDETFSAIQMQVAFLGRGVHPGSAKGALVNALKLAADFLASLPRDRLSPETTEEREGFVHPTRIEGDVERCRVELILRDFDDDLLAEHEALTRRLADAAVASEPRASVEVQTRQMYRNMKVYLDRHPRAIDAACEAIRRAGVDPISSLIRGGTDGAVLSERGLPTPNLFTGGHTYHSPREWICVQDMGAATETIVHLVQVYADSGKR